MITSNRDQLECESLISQLKVLSCFPAHIQVARCEGISIVNVADRPFSAGLVDTDTFVGFAPNPHLALSIALTEYVERRVCRNNPNMPYANEGVAGRSLFPGYDLSQACEHAQVSARNEAIERHVWASWWDNPSVGSTVEECSVQFARGTLYAPLVTHVQRLFPNGRFVIIKPNYSDQWNTSVQIVFYFLPSDAGVISGGACGSRAEGEKILFRALSELMRHAQALHRAKTNPTLEAHNLYNRRLLYFGSEDGGRLASARLNAKDGGILEMPALSIDAFVAHPFESAIVLHQCRFTGQPEFIGGAVERLCL